MTSTIYRSIMTHWWLTVTIPGWVASHITHLPNASSVISFRRMIRYTDNAIEVVNKQTTYGFKIEKETTCVIGDVPYTGVTREIDTTYTRTTNGIVSSMSTMYWTIPTSHGDIHVHKCINDDTSSPVQWQVEMYEEAPDADVLLRVIEKHISL